MVGNKERFGIECHLRRSGKPIIGDLWLWADNRRIGDDVERCRSPVGDVSVVSTLYLVGRPDIAVLRELTRGDYSCVSHADFWRRSRHP